MNLMIREITTLIEDELHNHNYKSLQAKIANRDQSILLNRFG